MALKEVDRPDSPVEWIVSVSMLTEGWDVKNVFQVVPHESRAFSSKLLIAQVLGRGMRVPAQLSTEPLLTINNHQAWSERIGDLLKEVLEEENALSWGYDPRRAKHLFPIFNLNYQPEETGVESKRERASTPEVRFVPQERVTTEYSKFSETGLLGVEVQHRDLYEIDDAVKLVRLFLREKDEEIARDWTSSRVKGLIVSSLQAAGQDDFFLSRENLLLLQQGFGPMFRRLGESHPRIGQSPIDIIEIDLRTIPRQSFSESMLKEHGAVWAVAEDLPYEGLELELWKQYQRLRRQYREYGVEASEQAQAIGPKIHDVEQEKFRLPWNVHYVTYEPERTFSELLFENQSLFDAFIKMPNLGGYSFPYSYKPSGAAKTHVANEHFSPDFFLKLTGAFDVLVVEIKDEGDDSNRNRAKCRDGLKHFEVLNDRLSQLQEQWRYHFYFLSPEDFANFFERVRVRNFEGWRSSLMQQLDTS